MAAKAERRLGSSAYGHLPRGAWAKITVAVSYTHLLKLCGGAQDLKDLEGGGADSRRQGVGEQIGAGALTQQVDDLLAARCEACLLYTSRCV